jgi:hypothetical protein
MLYAILMTEAEIARDIGAHGVGIEHHGVQQWSEHAGQRGLAGSRQTHDEDLAMHAPPRSSAIRRAHCVLSSTSVHDFMTVKTSLPVLT